MHTLLLREKVGDTGILECSTCNRVEHISVHDNGNFYGLTKAIVKGDVRAGHHFFHIGTDPNATVTYDMNAGEYT